MSTTNLLVLAREVLSQAIQESDICVDATTGNGHDTEYLAELVGGSGYVYGFDVQPAAILATSERLENAGVAARVTLFQADHADFQTYLPSELKGRLGAVVFNLGYLPGSDKQIITRREATLAAATGLADWLRPQGVMVIVAYTGHEGGREEADAVKAWSDSLDASFEVQHVVPATENSPPELFLMRRR